MTKISQKSLLMSLICSMYYLEETRKVITETEMDIPGEISELLDFEKKSNSDMYKLLFGDN